MDKATHYSAAKPLYQIGAISIAPLGFYSEPALSVAIATPLFASACIHGVSGVAALNGDPVFFSDAPRTAIRRAGIMNKRKARDGKAVS